MKSCATHGPSVIILDNLAHLVGADYNNAKLIHELNRFVWQLATDFNAAVIIAAHPRKRDKKQNSKPTTLRDDPEGFFEEVMGSSHFVNSCGSLWGIERDLSSDRTDFLGGTQRLTGQQSLMTLEKDEDDWLQPVSDLDVCLADALKTTKRQQAWHLLPAAAFSYTEAEKAVKPAISSSSSFNEWFNQLKRVGLVIPDGEKYRKHDLGTVGRAVLGTPQK